MPRRSTRIAVCALVVLTLAGCATGTVPPPGTASTPAATTSAAPVVTPGTTPSTQPGTTPSTPPSTPPSTTPGGDGSNPSNGVPGGGGTAAPGAVRTCAPDAVEVRLGAPDAGAGNIDYPVVLTNVGSVPCTVSGAPTARLLTAENEQLGADASGSGAAGPVVRLAPGAAAETVVRIVNVGDGGGPLAGSCTPRLAVALAIDSDVYGRYDRLDGDFSGCVERDVDTMTVTPFSAA